MTKHQLLPLLFLPLSVMFLNSSGCGDDYEPYYRENQDCKNSCDLHPVSYNISLNGDTRVLRLSTMRRWEISDITLPEFRITSLKDPLHYTSPNGDLEIQVNKSNQKELQISVKESEKPRSIEINMLVMESSDYYGSYKLITINQGDIKPESLEYRIE